MSDDGPKSRKVLWPFLLFLGVFYAAWGWLVVSGQHLTTLAGHWPAAVAMAAGSYFAGSTPMGGGTVGFPILVLLLEEPARLGRDFSFAVQSIGMTSAGLFILCRRQPLEWPMLRAALVGTLVGTPLGVLFVAPVASELFVKLLFAVLWGSFGILHLLRINEIVRHVGITPMNVRFDTLAGMTVGLVGGACVASVTGVGIDMMVYTVLVLLCHADIRIAVATSVVLMAATSVIGTATKLLAGTMEPGVFGHWLAAAPIVAVGAPVGAWFVRRLGRRPTLLLVSLLCVGQFGWTLLHEASLLGPVTLAAVFGGLVVLLVLFQWLHDLGDRWARRAGGAG